MFEGKTSGIGSCCLKAVCMQRTETLGTKTLNTNTSRFFLKKRKESVLHGMYTGKAPMRRRGNYIHPSLPPSSRGGEN